MAPMLLMLLAGVLALAVLPNLWIRRVIRQHSAERSDIPGTGGEFARHLLDRLNLQHVKVEETAQGDHYDPEIKAVRLLPAHMNGRSLAAVVIAAHEVGHAMQDATDYAPLRARTRLVKKAQQFETVGAIVMLAAPIVMVLSKSPIVLMLQIFAGVLILGMTILI
ncbi:MAG: zinc metallopeptidase, partial [Hyphomicrobiaceae bacterium]